MSERLFEVDADASVGEPVRASCGGKRFIELPGRGQMSLQVRCIEDFVPVDAPVRMFDEMLSRLDYSAFERHFPGGGRPAWPPMLLAKIVLFAYGLGIRSAREISRRLESDLRLMWLAQEQRIDHQRLSEFRRRFARELAELFVQTVRLAEELGLVELGLVAVDGSKVAASAPEPSHRRTRTWPATVWTLSARAHAAGVWHAPPRSARIAQRSGRWPSLTRRAGRRSRPSSPPRRRAASRVTTSF